MFLQVWKHISQTLWVYNLRILRIRNAKFPGHYFYMNTSIWGDFQTCFSVPLIVSSLLLYSFFILSSGFIALTYNASRVKTCSIPQFDDANICTSEVCNLAPIHISECFLTGLFFWLECSLKHVIMCRLVS